MRIVDKIGIVWAIIWGGFCALIWFAANPGDPNSTSGWFEWFLIGWLPVYGLLRSLVWSALPRRSRYRDW